MINLVVYMDDSSDAKDLVILLLKEGLVAHASIDVDNVSYSISKSVLQSNVNYVITAQTKAMLFTDIQQLIEEKYGESVPIYSLPITQANHSFDHWIRTNTKKI